MPTRVSRWQSDVAPRRVLRAGRGRPQVHRVQRGDAGGRRLQRRAVAGVHGDCRRCTRSSRTHCRAARFRRRRRVIHALLGRTTPGAACARSRRSCILDWAEVPTRSEFVLFEQRVRGAGHRRVHRRSARCGVHEWRAHVGGPPGHADLQAGADRRTGDARGARFAGGASGAGRRGVHGESVPLQDAAQEGQPRGGERRATGAAADARAAGGRGGARALDARGGGADDRARRARQVDLLAFIARTTANDSCSSRTTNTAARASSSAGRWTTRPGRTALQHSAGSTVYRAGARRGTQRAVARDGPTVRCISASGCWIRRRFLRMATA